MWRKWILSNVFFPQINSVYSFSGCLGNLQLNGASITSASQTFSVTPCFEGPMETGTYFSTEGGYVVLGNSDFCTKHESQNTSFPEVADREIGLRVKTSECQTHSALENGFFPPGSPLSPPATPNQTGAPVPVCFP